ncbi:hypothetical protein [Mycolicibacterium stellerae]|uniref:hypothetical protein n=1 Tax=Mycolicibacterium stellerae TaxID=2358193 RepID=UPI000F0B6420|nr:hypothetical protein [Mycolicibacterium stellerae]
MDDAVWEASTPREKVLVSALDDWVDLGQIHSYVERANPGASLADIQAETLDLVRTLADEGLFLIGDLTGDGGRFVAWDTSTEASLQRIRGEYVERYDDKDRWPWYSWLDLTAEGDRVAHGVEAKLNQATETSTG